MITLIDDILRIGEKVFDKIFPDPAQKEKAMLELKNLAKSGEIEKISLQNQEIASAREREVKIAQAGYRDWVPCVLALGTLVIYAAVQIYTIYKPSSEAELLSARIQDLMLIVISYYFGTSYSSRKKDEVIASQNKDRRFPEPF